MRHSIMITVGSLLLNSYKAERFVIHSKVGEFEYNRESLMCSGFYSQGVTMFSPIKNGLEIWVHSDQKEFDDYYKSDIKELYEHITKEQG